MSDNPFLQVKKERKINVIALVVTFTAIIVTSIALFYFFVFTPNEVSGPSMLPNFEDGDFLLVSRPHTWFYGTEIANTLGITYERGDVVIFREPGAGDIVKRIIGKPGDSVRIENGVFFVNGEAVEEQFTILNNERLDGVFLIDGGSAVILDEGEFFLAGDNRDVSFDSRSLGPINISDIKGKVIFRIYPSESFGSIKRGDLGLN